MPNHSAVDGLIGQVNFEKCDDPPHLSFDGKAYSLVQMHIHSPSEHMVSIIPKERQKSRFVVIKTWFGIPKLALCYVFETFVTVFVRIVASTFLCIFFLIFSM